MPRIFIRGVLCALFFIAILGAILFVLSVHHGHNLSHHKGLLLFVLLIVFVVYAAAWSAIDNMHPGNFFEFCMQAVFFTVTLVAFAFGGLLLIAAFAGWS